MEEHSMEDKEKVLDFIEELVVNGGWVEFKPGVVAGFIADYLVNWW